MLGLTLLAGVAAVVATYFASRTSMGVGRDLRGIVFGRVMRFSAREMNSFGTASLITRNTNDVQQIQIFLQMALTLMVAAPIMMVGGVIMALHEDVTLSVLLVVAVPLMALIVVAMLFLAVPQFKSMQVKIDRINQVLREQITGVRVIRAFVRSDDEERRFAAANASLTATGLRVNRLFVLAMPLMMAIMNLSSVAVLWFGGHLISSGQMPIGNLTAFLAYILQILMSVLIAVVMFILVPRAQASAERIDGGGAGAAGDPEPRASGDPGSRQGGRRVPRCHLWLPGRRAAGAPRRLVPAPPRRDHRHHRWHRRRQDDSPEPHPALLRRDLRVRCSSTAWTSGSARLEELWACIGLVPQQAFLFSGTIADNLRFADDDATDADLWHALQVAQARDFVATMGGQLEAPIDQGGTNVSGGQRQRLAIARALVKRPLIYLFDDCFSALDAATDARLRAELSAETRDVTVVIVAQRVSTILSADRIIVLDDGVVVGSGTHEELMVSCPEYREIVVSQLGENAA